MPTIARSWILTSSMVALLLAPSPTSADVQALPLVPEVQTSTRYRVFVNERDVPVGVETTGGRTFDTAAFLSSGSANVRIVTGEAFSRCTIRPLRFKLREKAQFGATSPARKEIRFSLDRPRKLIIELDDRPPLLLIGSPPDDDLPDPGDPNVLYFGPGIHEPGRIRLQSNQTVYLAAGAKVYGTIEGTCIENVRITGRGHLYGTKHTNWEKRTYGIIFDRCRDVTVEKIAVRDCYWWATEFLLCDGVEIRDINMLTFNRNNGGLMIDSCSNLTARDSLLMTMDDCICPHALNAAGNGEEISHNLLFENLVLYNVFTGNAIRIGASFETSEVRNWTFRNIDVVERRGAAIYADHSDWAVVRNLVFENLTDEDTKQNSVDMRIDKTAYSCQTGYRDERGAFDGLFFINVRSRGGEFAFKGFDAEHGFKNVVLAGCHVGDKPLLDLEDIDANQFVTGVKFLQNNSPAVVRRLLEPSAENSPTATSPRELVLDDTDEGFTCYGFAPASMPGNAHGDGARIGKVANAFGNYAAAIYEPRIAGRYEVFAHCGKWIDTDDKAPWIIKHHDGYSRAYLNQVDNPGWHSLGTFQFDADSDVRLVYPNYFEPSDRPVVADALRFVRVAGD